MLANCGAMTKHIIKSSRGSSYAWFALARFETELSGMTDGFEAAILKSYATGPSEVWIAEQRVLLIEQTVEFVSPIVITNHLEDIELLVQTARGVRGIARLYVNYSDFRERVIAVVETLPNDVQARFLANVKRAAAETFSDE